MSHSAIYSRKRMINAFRYTTTERLTFEVKRTIGLRVGRVESKFSCLC